MPSDLFADEALSCEQIQMTWQTQKYHDKEYRFKWSLQQF